MNSCLTHDKHNECLQYLVSVNLPDAFIWCYERGDPFNAIIFQWFSCLIHLSTSIPSHKKRFSVKFECSFSLMRRYKTSSDPPTMNLARNVGGFPIMKPFYVDRPKGVHIPSPVSTTKLWLSISLFQICSYAKMWRMLCKRRNFCQRTCPVAVFTNPELSLWPSLKALVFLTAFILRQPFEGRIKSKWSFAIKICFS